MDVNEYIIELLDNAYVIDDKQALWKEAVLWDMVENIDSKRKIDYSKVYNKLGEHFFACIEEVMNESLQSKVKVTITVEEIKDDEKVSKS